MKVGILPTPGSNLGSIIGAISKLTANWEIIESHRHINLVDRIILPGVGSFYSAMRELNNKKLPQAIKSFADKGNPLLGICLGMQLFCEGSTEGGQTEGLGLVRGTVTDLKASPETRVPHVGWNSVNIFRNHPVLDGIPSGTDFYFVHGLALQENQDTQTIATTHHGVDFVSSVGRGNIVGVQFHPEKSQKQGAHLLKNFLSWDGEC